MRAHILLAVPLLIATTLLAAGCGGSSSDDAIAQVMKKPRYTSANSQWSMVVMDAATGETLIAL